MNAPSEESRLAPWRGVDGQLIESACIDALDQFWIDAVEDHLQPEVPDHGLLAIQGRHLILGGGKPYVKVRKRIRRRRGIGLVVGPLKSRHSRRELPIPGEIAVRLAALETDPDELVFNTEGKPLDPDNLYSRVLRPAVEEASVEWAGFHTFRHTIASRLFAEGRNAVQVQRWLGHHSPSFTLDTDVHLLDPDLGEPIGGSDQLAA